MAIADLVPTDPYGVLAGAVISIFTSLAFNRHTEFKKTRDAMVFSVVHLSKCLHELDDSHGTTHDLWLQADAIVRREFDPFYFSFAAQKQNGARDRLGSFIQSVVNSLWSIHEQVSKMPDDDIELRQFSGRRAVLAKIPFGFCCHRISTEAAPSMMKWQPDWLLIISGVPSRLVPANDGKVI